MGPKVGGCFIVWRGLCWDFGVEGLMTVDFRSLWIEEVTECTRFLEFLLRP